MLLDNTSGLLIREPYYQVVLWLLSMPDSPPIVWSDSITKAWIRPHEHYGPVQLMDVRLANVAKAGDELYGYGIITCPDCTATKAYSIGVRIGGRGWYRELEPGFYPWDTANWVKGFAKLPWKSVNEIPVFPGERRKQILDRPIF